MTAAEWLTGADPDEMQMALLKLNVLTDRKLRLFKCAAVRLVWDVLPDDTLRRAVDTCERFMEGMATAEELASARDAADATYEGLGDIIADHSALRVTELCDAELSLQHTGFTNGISAIAAEAWSGGGLTWDNAWDRAQRFQSDLLREIVGNPFRPVAIDPQWLTSTVVSLAHGIYDTLAFDHLPILADALQDAGCEDADVLAHCLSPGPHVRGCWVVDLLTGRR